jgi:hypothetical protein
VKDWFEEYETALLTYKIERDQIHNFDETGFQVGCLKGQEVIVPIKVKELYSLSPKDR